MTYNYNAPQDVNFRKVYQKANEILATSSAIETFPYKTKSVVREQSDIAFCTFEAAKRIGVCIEQFGSGSAVLTESDGAYIIFYNQDEASYRIRFSVMHEFGHYIFSHHMNLSKEDPLYSIQEIEANCFAAQMLMPEQLIRECAYRGKMISVDYIKQSFGVSLDAAQKRKTTLAKTVYEWRSRAEREYDDIIILRFASKLDEIAPKPRYFAYDLEDDYAKEQERNRWLYERK